MNENKILAVADVHGDWEKIPVAGHDLVIIAGDIRPGSMRREDRIRYANWAGEFFGWISNFPGTEFVMVSGNHDFELNADKFPAAVRNCPKNAHILCDEEWNWQGLRIYGTPWTTMGNEGWTKRESPDLIERFGMIPSGLDILVTHTPLYWEDTKFITPNCSCELTDAIRAKRPRLVICGHEHRLDHAPFKIGASTVVLVSMKERKEDAIFKYPAYEFEMQNNLQFHQLNDE